MTRDLDADPNNPLIQGGASHQVEDVSLLNDSSSIGGLPLMNKFTIRHSKTFREKKRVSLADAVHA